ncbi:MAG: hypothetical protein WBF89_18950 [Steroidobacteraceae bacterium]
MKPNMRRNFPGTFATRDLKEGAWRLSCVEPTPIDVFIRGADSTAADTLRRSGVRDVDVEWCVEGVVLTVTSDGRRASVRAQSALVHEPLGRLYEALPLANLDEKARRFWRRVFRLVRIPGGRHLLGLLAPRSRARR